jgi:hypothetical protein
VILSVGRSLSVGDDEIEGEGFRTISGSGKLRALAEGNTRSGTVGVAECDDFAKNFVT